jgi:hypothetical protein
MYVLNHILPINYQVSNCTVRPPAANWQLGEKFIKAKKHIREIQLSSRISSDEAESSGICQLLHWFAW